MDKFLINKKKSNKKSKKKHKKLKNVNQFWLKTLKKNAQKQIKKKLN